uniref:Uncharacterized protein n=1 Tax=viral metagenome TaxID=1070528 RepID=A0A6M3JF90_9ZZZZ
MTKLRKTVQRETEGVFRGKPLIIQLEAPNIIRIKEKGRRSWHETTTERVFLMAAQTSAQKIIQERREKKREKKWG